MTHTEFEHFSPADYLETYYPSDSIGHENSQLLKFYANVFNHTLGKTYLEIGGGPTLYQIISAANVVDSIVFTDYVPANLEAHGEQLNADNSGRWEQYVRTALQYEKSDESLDERFKILRNKVTHRRLDIKNQDQFSTLLEEYGGFDIVSSAFCIDSITESREEWQRLLSRLITALKPGGTLILTSLCNSTKGYAVGAETFPAVLMNENEYIEAVQRHGLVIDERTYCMIEAEKGHNDSYSGLLCLSANKPEYAYGSPT